MKIWIERDYDEVIIHAEEPEWYWSNNYYGPLWKSDEAKQLHACAAAIKRVLQLQRLPVRDELKL